MKEHPQAPTLRLIADGKRLDAKVTPACTWEPVASSEALRAIGEGMCWEFREHVPTIEINEHFVPLPLREAPTLGTLVHVLSLVSLDGVSCFKWTGAADQVQYLRMGICHISEANAIIHAQALISFTKED